MNKKENGITLITLVVTIVVMLILAGITVKSGKSAIKNANLEEMKTNMLLIQTKAKEYVENANFDLGVKPDEATDEMKTKAKSELTGADKGEQISSNDSIVSQLTIMGINPDDITNGNVYKLTTENLNNMGIKKVESNEENGWYVIVYNISEVSAEIYNTKGFDNRYSLTDIEQIELQD